MLTPAGSPRRGRVFGLMAAALSATHHLLPAHGLAVESFRQEAMPGEIGLVINPATSRPVTRGQTDRNAAARASVERAGLWLDPLFGRGYPVAHLEAHDAGMQALPGDMALIAAPVEFVGVN